MSSNSPRDSCNFNIDPNLYFSRVVTFVEESFKEASDVNGVYSGQSVHLSDRICQDPRSITNKQLRK